jgi:acyl-CoA synthetase (AMP-forming)/AMP-acid ligase II
VLTVSQLTGKREIREAAAAPLADVPWIATDTIADLDVGSGPIPPIDADAVAFLQYTSGSTGTPKGTAVTHANISANLEMIKAAFGHDETTRFVSWLPMFHDMGLVGTMLQSIYLGASSVLMSPLAFLQRPERWLRAISDHRGTTSGAPNFAFDLCVRRMTVEMKEGLDLSSWRVAFCGAEPVRKATLARFAEEFAPAGFRPEALNPCYGMSETTALISVGPSGEGMKVLSVDGEALSDRNEVVITPATSPRARAVVNCGRSWGDQRVAVVDPGLGLPVSPGRVGEIWVTGSHVGAGYWQQPEATASVFGARIAGDASDYLRTGDLGFLHQGDLFVTGRLKDLVIVRGSKHHPEEIEYTASVSHPALAGSSAAVFSVDDGEGQRVIVAHEVDRHNLAALDVGGVARAVRDAVADGHGFLPDDVVLLRHGTLPRTTSGKVQRHRCREAYLTARWASQRETPRQEARG